MSLYEYKTSAFKIQKIQKCINIMKDLENVKEEKNVTKKIKNNIYNHLLKITSQEEENLNISIPKKYQNSFISASPWIFFTILMIPSLLRKEPNATDGILGSILIAFIVGLGAFFIQNNLLFWVYTILINVFIFTIVVWKGKKNNEKY